MSDRQELEELRRLEELEARAMRAQPVNPAAANPEANTPFGAIKGEIGETAMFNPAAAVIKAGDWFSRINRGILEAKHAPADLLRGGPSVVTDAIRADREFAKQPMQELEAIHPGSAQVGEMGAMMAVPPAALPFVAAAEEGSIPERLARGGLAYAGNKATMAAGKYLADAPQRAAQAKAANAVRDQVVRESQQAGYVVPPSAAGAGLPSRILEGLSGKAKTEQLATIKNQPVTDNLARKALGLANDAPLEESTLKALRAEAYDKGYLPIAKLPAIADDTPFLSGLTTLKPQSAGGAVKNPAAAEIKDLVDSLGQQGQWTGQQLIRDIQFLRGQSRALFNSAEREGGNTAKTELARAQSEAAKMLEELAERNMAKQGMAGQIKAFREARKVIAKSGTIEDALVNGSVDAAKIAAAKRRGVPLEAELLTIAKFASDKQMGKSAGMPVAGAANPVTVLDAFGTAAGSATGLGLASLAWPAARVGSRYGILSKPYQAGFVRPDYDPNLLVRGGARLLDNRFAPPAMGLLGYEMGQ